MPHKIQNKIQNVSSVTKALLGLLPIIALLIFSLKCYFVVKYRRMWAVTSYYKLYPLTMVVLLINLLLHDLPQTILGMIFIILALLRQIWAQYSWAPQWTCWKIETSLFLLRSLQTSFIWSSNRKSYSTLLRYSCCSSNYCFTRYISTANTRYAFHFRSQCYALSAII